jgi:2-oxoglutarate ferredoxin oxidoreductase subunit gamma
MQTEIVISGFGGQGALFAGQLLAHAALDAGMHTTWFPSYGPEMRGGTAHCTTILSDAPIGSPVVRNPRAAIVLNLPSLERYEPLVKAGGVLAVNSSIIAKATTRADLQVLRVPADEVAQELGSPRVANLVLLGALLARLPVLDLDDVKRTLEHAIPAHRRDLLPTNLEALTRGAALAPAEATPV